jgi:hypothetical protein
VVLEGPAAIADGAVGLSINLAFGGSNAALLFRGWPGAARSGESAAASPSGGRSTQGAA